MTHDDERKEATPSDFVGKIETIARYAPQQLLLSGWIRDPQVIENQSGWMRADYGQGGVHLFGFRPQYRGWTRATFPLIFRAVLLEPGLRQRP